jgi:WD40 repeat protein
MSEESIPSTGSNTPEPPQLYALTREAGAWRMDRRAFLRAAGTASTAAAMGVTAVSAGESLKPPDGNRMLVDESLKAVFPKAHKGSVKSVAFSADGSLLASAGSDRTIRLWSLPDGKLRAKLTGHDTDIVGVSFSPQSNFLVSGGSDGTIKVWSVPAGETQATFGGEGFSIKSLAISPDGKLLATAGYQMVKLWSLPAGDPLVTLKDLNNWVTAIAFSPDSKSLASAVSLARMIDLWSIPGGDWQSALEGHGSSVSSLAFGSDGKSLASGSWDKTIKLCRLSDGAIQATLIGHSDGIKAIACAADGKLLASAANKTIMLWSMPDGEFRSTLQGHTTWVNSVAFDPVAEILASADDDGRILLWEINGRKRRWLLFDHGLLDGQARFAGFVDRKRVPGTPPCTCNTVMLPAGASVPPGTVCVCDTITMGPAIRDPNRVAEVTRTLAGSLCSCDTVCTCNTVLRTPAVASGDTPPWIRPNKSIAGKSDNNIAGKSSGNEIQRGPYKRKDSTTKSSGGYSRGYSGGYHTVCTCNTVHYWHPT